MANLLFSSKAKSVSEAFHVKINDLRLSLVFSWYEQKAVAKLLSLFFLGIKKIRFGPSLHAFIIPSILKVLVEKFNIMLITTPEENLESVMNYPVYWTRGSIIFAVYFFSHFLAR
jgi:hydroxylamine reductase